MFDCSLAIAGCGATIVHDIVYNPAEGELNNLSIHPWIPYKYF